MSMAIYEEVEIPKPKYKNTIVCEKCWAEFDQSCNWSRGFYVTDFSSTASPRFIRTSDIEKGRCPVCS